MYSYIVRKHFPEVCNRKLRMPYSWNVCVINLVEERSRFKNLTLFWMVWKQNDENFSKVQECFSGNRIAYSLPWNCMQHGFAVFLFQRDDAALLTAIGLALYKCACCIRVYRKENGISRGIMGVMFWFKTFKFRLQRLFIVKFL